MENYQIRSEIIHLKSINENEASPKLSQKMRQAQERGDPGEILKIEQVGVIKFEGRRYYINAPRLTIIESLDRFDRFSPVYEDELIAHAIKQLVKLRDADRKYVEVEVRSINVSDDGDHSDWQAHVYWNHRKQYEQLYFYLIY